MPSTIIEIYKKIKNNESVDTSRFKSDFISDCFKYGWLKEKPSKNHIKWFETAFECKYPEYLSDIKKPLEKEMKSLIRQRKDEEKKEEKWRQQRAKRGFSDCDCYNLYSWFLEVMPQMLQKMRDGLHGYPADMIGLQQKTQAISDTALNDNAEEEPGFIKRKETLDRMIFLLKEMDEETCSYENPYTEDLFKMNEDFRKKYGFGGEELKSDEEKAKEKKNGSHRMYFPSDFPELYPDAKDLSHHYFTCEQNKQIYMDKCREEFFNLFSMNFYSLWD